MPARHQIYVEGNTDQHVLRNLLREHGIACELYDRNRLDDSPIVIRNMNGYETLVRSLEAGLDDPTLERLAIIVDADMDFSARLTSLQNRLVQLGAINLPKLPDTQGMVALVQRSDRDVPVGVWVMPDNAAVGHLETFLSFLVPAGDVLWPHAQAVVRALPERRFHDMAHDKALVHTWLAWQEKPGLPLGQAVTAHYLDTKSIHARQFVSWIKHLFDLT